MKFVFLIAFLLLVGLCCYKGSKMISIDWVIKVTKTGINVTFALLWVIIAIAATALVL